MSKLTALFEDYNDVELIDFCISRLYTRRCNWDYCTTVDDSTGDIYTDECAKRFNDLITWFCEFYDTDEDSLRDGIYPEPQPDSYTSGYTTENGTLILVQNHYL